MLSDDIANILNAVSKKDSKVIVRCGGFAYDIFQIDLSDGTIHFDIDIDSRRYILPAMDADIVEAVEAVELSLDDVDPDAPLEVRSDAELESLVTQALADSDSTVVRFAVNKKG